METLMQTSWTFRHNVTSYGALYIALALHGNATLVTADRPMASAAEGRCAVELIAAES